MADVIVRATLVLLFCMNTPFCTGQRQRETETEIDWQRFSGVYSVSLSLSHL